VKKGASALAYDLRIPALKGGVFRGDDYFFLEGVTPDCSYVTYNSNDRPQTDGLFDDNPGLAAYISANMLHGGFLRAAVAAANSTTTATTLSSRDTTTAPYIHTFITQLPPVTWIPETGVAPPSPYQTLFWPLFTMTTLPGIVSGVSMEKEEKLWAMMSMSGVRRTPYLCAHWAVGFLGYVPIGAAYMLAGWSVGSASFSLPSPGLLVALLLVWGVSQAGWGVFLGSIITAPRVGSLIMYLLAVCVALTNLIVTQTVTPFPTYFVQIPFLSYARASTLVLSCAGTPTGARGADIWNALGITLAHGLAALALGMYIHAVLPGPEQTGVPLHPLFPIFTLRDYFFPAGGKKEAGGGGGGKKGGAGSFGWSVESDAFLENNRREETLDVDVEAEAARASEAVSQLRLSSDSPSSHLHPPAILLHDIRKTYAPPIIRELWHRLTHNCASPTEISKQAVAGVSLCVPFGETLGLLGPNGAGKTTIISMLTGAAAPTGGGACIGGLDIAQDMSRVWRRLGVCPQFDCVWPDLSVSSHLRFYAMVKGIDAASRNSAVQQSAEKVGLDGDSFNMPAGKLSGGQRRRLSIAISLLGDPQVVFLDEPTTGLDPENRNGIHRILSAERREGRALLLTTHSMDEADVLCDRIAIVASGKLAAVGSQLRLKHRFGSGYRLTLHLNPPSPAALEATAARAHAFVMRSLSSKSQLLSRVGNTLSYVLPRGIDVAGVFAQVDGVRRSRSEGIQEFGVQQASLEEVFIKVVRNAGGLEGTGTTLSNKTVLSTM